jgi:negative regulator of sigma E activity
MKDDSKTGDDRFAAAVAASLEANLSEDRTEDEALARRFAAMRSEALRHIPAGNAASGPVQTSSAEARPRRPLSAWALPGAGFAAAAAVLLAVALWVGLPGGQQAVSELAALNEWDVLTLGEDIDMLEEELEFYMWLESEPEAG